MTIGKVAALDFGSAKNTAKDLYAQVRLGADPADAKAEAKVKAAETFEAAVRAYLARQRARLRPRSYSEVERHLLVNAKPLHGLGLTGVHRRDVATLLNS